MSKGIEVEEGTLEPRGRIFGAIKEAAFFTR